MLRNSEVNITDNKTKRIIFFLLGITFTIIGIIGVILPLMPGVIFLIIAAFFFTKSSKRFHLWIVNNKYFGHYIRGYYAGEKMPLRAKVITVILISISVIVGVFLI